MATQSEVGAGLSVGQPSGSLARPVGRMAIAHEWIAARAGSEKVFEEFARCFPEADLFALTQTPGVEIDTGGRLIRRTFLDRFGLLRERRALALPAMPAAWRWIARGESYDTVLTSSHACVKGFRPGRSARHFCYVHTPMRYVWHPEIDGRGSSIYAAPARAAMGRWDRRSARWVDSFAANSTAVAERILTVYGRNARVIHPPVDTAYFAGAEDGARGGLVTLGRFIPYKGHELALEVAARLGEPIKVVGRGPDESRLREYARRVGARAEFVVDAPDDQVRAAVASARALVFAANEDFGIVPVEAQAAGTPVVGPSAGGLLDTVVDNVTGALATDLSVDALVDAASRLLASDVNAEDCRTNAARFGVERFGDEIRAWLSGPADNDG